jgi:hypothetical protein
LQSAIKRWLVNISPRTNLPRGLLHIVLVAKLAGAPQLLVIRVQQEEEELSKCDLKWIARI